jgi:hypothetical protein
MAELNVSSELPSFQPMPPPRSRPAPKTDTAASDQAEWSDAALDDRQLRDAILMKIALEGKDYRTARREVLEQRLAEAAKTQDPRSAPANDPTPASFQAEVTTLEVEHVRVEVSTPEAHLAFEATRIEYTHLSVSRRSEPRKQDPLVIDLSGQSPQLTGLERGLPFDLDGDGWASPTSFVRGDTAFLALDRDGDGLISSGKELFGDQHGAMDGYEELRKFDADANGRIDAADPVYSQLRLLYGDLDQFSLEAAGIRSFALDARISGQPLASGDTILRTATAALSDGRNLPTYAMALQTLDMTG